MGLKQYETRSWGTKYRGQILIHAAKRNYAQDAVYLAKQHPALDTAIAAALPLPRGAVVAIADLANCLEMIEDLSKSPSVAANIHLQTSLELAVGNWAQGRYAWKLENIRALPEPIECKGNQGLWSPDQQTQDKLTKQKK